MRRALSLSALSLDPFDTLSFRVGGTSAIPAALTMHLPPPCALMEMDGLHSGMDRRY